ncbi:MAG: PEP-CTERM sorting domain-containing protein [candidate division NC10 bacterium]|nr:PEP-CTERM sorting domain-containing protein [candidate division NC10 bacterium]
MVQRLRGLISTIVVLLACSSAQAIPVLGTNFTGITLDTTIALGTGAAPPDTMGAVGPGHIVELVNGAYAVYTKAGGGVTTPITDKAFWTNAGLSLGSVGLTDPRVVYDHASGRWFAAQITTSNTHNEVLVARSNSSDPTAGWKAARFTGNTGFADFPTLSLDAGGVYIGTNNFTSASGPFKSVSLFSMPKSDLLASSPSLANMTRFDDLPANDRGFTLQGASNFGPSTGHGAIVAVDNDFFGQIDRFNVLGPGGAGATLSATTAVNVAPTSFPPNAKQPDGTTQIDTTDDRFGANVVQVGDLLFMVHTIGMTGRAALRWTILSESTNAVIQEDTIADPNFDFYFGAIAANSFGDVVVAYNRSGTEAGDFIGSFASVGEFTGGALTFGAPMLLKAGLANYHLFGGSNERWGDYSAVVLDPSDPFSFWAFQEFAATPVSGQSRWATQITQIIVTPIPEPGTILLVSTGVAGLAGYRRWRRSRDVPRHTCREAGFLDLRCYRQRSRTGNTGKWFSGYSCPNSTGPLCQRSRRGKGPAATRIKP